MKRVEKRQRTAGDIGLELSRKSPDAETFCGYGVAGCVARRCRRIFPADSQWNTRSGAEEISPNERRDIIEGFIHNIKERIVNFIDREVSAADVDSAHPAAMGEWQRVSQSDAFKAENALTVVFDDGSAFLYGDGGYEAYFANTLRVPMAVTLN
ncbi:MAG: hypothetical protein ACT4NX_01885 [Deltaproteobacteria bacterium]